MKKIIFIITAPILFLYSCSTTKTMSDNQVADGHFRLYSYPLKDVIKKYDTARYKRIVLIGSNNLEGQIKPSIFPIKNKFQEKRELAIGGITATKSYLDIFRESFPDQTLYLDAGSLVHPSFSARKTIFYMNYLSLDVLGLGLNEILYAQNNRKGKSLSILNKRSKFKIINSNLSYLVSDKQLKDHGILPHNIQIVNGVKIGFISILTKDLTKKISDQNINGLHLEDTARSVIMNSNMLRRRGAEVVVLLADRGLDCTTKEATEDGIHPLKVNFYPHRNEFCDLEENQLYSTLTKIPKSSIDIVFTSGNLSKVANFINKFPVIQTPGKGQYLGWAEVYFDLKHQKVDSKKTIIHQPVQLCHQFLKNHQDCFTAEGLENKELMPAYFLGKQVITGELPKK